MARQLTELVEDYERELLSCSDWLDEFPGPCSWVVLEKWAESGTIRSPGKAGSARQLHDPKRSARYPFE